MTPVLTSGDPWGVSPQTVGVIVRLERENLHVLNMHGKIIKVKPQAVHKKKDSRYAVALDTEQNTIQKKDIVKVIDGPHSVGQRCRVLRYTGVSWDQCWD